ncbi:MAG: ABC exporter membrane fusion protein [Merismopedia sp. SIO2A8]|nr:ABC exporter membrane fusion protein [Symploca sp. SIO2B6]NET49442.1 ABC exporter membrane fusion protein [Merismopedia sp. SIO2A8]
MIDSHQHSLDALKDKTKKLLNKEVTSPQQPLVKKTRSRKRSWVLGITGGAIAVGILGLGIAKLTTLNQAQLSSKTPTEAAAPLPKRVAVVALGRLEPQGEVIRVSGLSGERISKLQVSEGDLVATGEVLAYLESYEERLAERDFAASQLAEAQAKLQAETTYGRAKIQEATTHIQQIERPTTFEIAAQQATVRQLEAELALANEDWRRFEDLYSEGAITKQELDQQRTKARETQEQLNNAQATLIRLEQARDTDLRYAQTQLHSAHADLNLAQVEVALGSAQKNLKLAQTRLERTIIKSPTAGRILTIFTKAGEAIDSEGILDLGDTTQMYAVAEVYETDVGLVKMGQPVTVTSRNGAFAETLTGEVAEIGWQIFKNDVLDDDPAADADARVVEVKIRLDESEPVERLTNLQVDVRIDIDAIAQKDIDNSGSGIPH